MNCEGFTVSGSLIAGKKTLSNHAELDGGGLQNLQNPASLPRWLHVFFTMGSWPTRKSRNDKNNNDARIFFFFFSHSSSRRGTNINKEETCRVEQKIHCDRG